jgi:hypothetical protein
MVSILGWTIPAGSVVLFFASEHEMAKAKQGMNNWNKYLILSIVNGLTGLPAL